MGIFNELLAPPARSKRPHILRAMSWAVDKDGNLLWVDPWVENILHDEGEQYILARVFDTDYANYTTTVANMYIGLDNRATLAEADTLATVAANGEPTTGGYSRKVVSTSTGFTITQPGAYYQAASATVSFTASGAAMGTVKNRFLCTHASATTSAADQRLIASLALSTTRTINDGDTLNTNLILGLSE